MIKLRIRIKSEATTFIKNEFLSDAYVISKQNKELEELVEKAVKESGFQVVDEVKITAQFEW